MIGSDKDECWRELLRKLIRAIKQREASQYTGFLYFSSPLTIVFQAFISLVDTAAYVICASVAPMEQIWFICCMTPFY